MSSRVNEANGENLQDPPIKNPGYANGKTRKQTVFDQSSNLKVRPTTLPT